MFNKSPLITADSFLNFFKYYKGEPHQVEAVNQLFKDINSKLLQEDAAWIKTYRKQDEKTNSTSEWPITKEQMAAIMKCSVSSLPDTLMNDFARCCDIFGMNKINIAYFLGQCGHESAGLRYPVEIHSGSNYEYRRDLGNVKPRDGVKYAGTGWIQVTGRWNHQAFSNYLEYKGKPDPNVMLLGKTYTSEVYPWTISGHWWLTNGMIEFCNQRPDVDEVGARVNGRYLPNGYQDRRDYTARAFKVLGL